jgi:hypothetical protein
MNKKLSLIILTSVTATFVALCAAFFSVTGISKLFAGATLGVLIMASALEFGKLVSISFLYQYWTEIPKLLKAYLTTASAVLMLITSVGIYGYLSAAYQATADQLAIMDRQTDVINLKKERYQEQLSLFLQERERLSTSIEELSRGLANNVVQYRDAQTGQLITSTSAANRTALQQQLTSAADERTQLASRVEQLTDSIASLDLQALELSMNNDLAAEIGPLRFISNLTGWPIDQVVNIFALMIVFVFDPLAIALVISVNFLLKHRTLQKEEEFLPISNSTALSSSISPTTTTPDDKEPYQVYTPEQITENNTPIEPSPEVKEKLEREFLEKHFGGSLNSEGIPLWMTSDFNWNDTDSWIHNQLAKFYKKKIIDKR